jgi:S1-C subfamily serine protease
MNRLGLLFLAVAVLASVEPADGADKVASSVVKIFTTHRSPNYQRPWEKGSPQESSGSGAIIEGKLVLTNAHVVLYASQIFVQADQSTERIAAKVRAVAPAIDLAVLEVETPSFFDGHPPLSISDDLPAVKQTVHVYGYPMGGQQLSITRGIVSRIEYTDISCGVPALRVQVDAALNPGNSGGPAVSDGKITGLVFSKITQGDNIGYLIAADEIRDFLKQVANCKYLGKFLLWDGWQSAENDALRARLGLAKETGVIVNAPFSSAADYPLKKWDLITHVGGKPIDNHGDVTVTDSMRLSFQYYISKLARDGRVKLTVFRDRKSLDIEVPLRRDPNYVMPYLAGKYPRYFVYGPMVFVPATQELATKLTEGGTEWVSVMTSTQSPLLSRQADHPAFDGEEIVTIGYGLLPHKISQGYNVGSYSAVRCVNGVPIRSLAHVVELLRDARGEFITVELIGQTNPLLVFRRQELTQAAEDILADEGIRKQYSDDLEKLWHAKNRSSSGSHMK